MDATLRDPAMPASKAELLDRNQATYDALVQAVERLSPEALTQPIPGDTWSAKDILAHIVAWQQVLLHMHIGSQSFRQVTGLTTVEYGSENIDRINEAFYQRDRALPLAQVRAALARSHGDVMAKIVDMEEAQLFGPYAPAGATGEPGMLIQWIAGDTFEHYAEHAATIARLENAG